MFHRGSVRAFKKSQKDKRPQLEELADFFKFDRSVLPKETEVLKITKTRAFALLLKEKIRVIEFTRVGSVAAFEVSNSSNMDPFGSFRTVGYHNGTFFELEAYKPIPIIKSEFLGKGSSFVWSLIISISLRIFSTTTINKETRTGCSI